MIHRSDEYPRTDHSEILANFIGIAPQVEGPILRLSVHDNQLVKQGDLLFEIDDRPYRYALQRAVSKQATLEGPISDERRKISALVSAVSVSKDNIQATQADVSRSAAAVDRPARVVYRGFLPHSAPMYSVFDNRCSLMRPQSEAGPIGSN